METHLDSPTGRNVKPSKANNSQSNGNENDKESNNTVDNLGESTSMHPPSTSSCTPGLSPYMHHYMMQAYEQRVPPSSSSQFASSSSPYDTPPRKRHHRSPSDSSIRASVLRDGSKPERDSPLSLTYSHPNTPPPHQDYPRHSTPPSSLRYDVGGEGSTVLAPSNSTTVVPAASFDRAAAVESDNSPNVWNSSSSCPEDLRIKLESPASERVKSEWGYNEGNPPMESTPEIVPSNVWQPTSGTSTKLCTAHKGAATATTPDGKKLQCPFCERLYGYETNLRAHIRQRHQGIRVPCPFCTRTFTRNNTVRRHIAREHKTELSLKAFQQTQVQNHNQ
uniref:C2H2-type domain-containing protein n=1 Tax=Clastoptera arizonana TaxID=38151 RepID=A0A1B6E4E8_9HEMI